MARSNYNDQVFINCPFDGPYVDMFRACAFTILDAGFIPRCSKEVDNANLFRLEAIVKIVRGCRFGVHDLSRVELDAKSHLPRFNMPFELGIFYSAKHFGGAKHKQKQCIILERHKYRYHKFISDISGIDVTPHGNSIKSLIQVVRNWLVTTSRRSNIPTGNDIYSRFRSFQTEMRYACRKRSLDYDAMPFVELINNMTDWLRINQLNHIPIFGP